jgi:uncharacterized protein (TIGR03066 family)
MPLLIGLPPLPLRNAVRGTAAAGRTRLEQDVVKAMCVIVVTVALLGLTTAARTDEPKKEDTVTKLLGRWTVTKAADEQLVGAIVTFEKGGKVSVVRKADGKETKLDGTYRVEKDTLISDIGGNTDTNAIKRLTADALELENQDSRVVTILKKTR